MRHQLDFSAIDTAINEQRRNLANWCAELYHEGSERAIRLSAGDMSGMRVNGIPVHLGSMVLLYADTSALMALAKQGKLPFLRGYLGK